MGQAVNVLSLQLVLAPSLLLLSGKLCRYRSVCVASLAFVYLCQSEKPCHLNIKTVYAFSPTLKQTWQSAGNREIQKRVAAITQSEAGKHPKSSACVHKVHINIHSELPLTHSHTNAHTHTGVNVCARHTCTSTTLCVSLLTQALQVPLTARTVAVGLTRSAVPSLSLRVTTLPLNQTRTTARTVIKQTSSRSLRQLHIYVQPHWSKAISFFLVANQV